MKRLALLFSTLLLVIPALAQREHGVRPTSTGGPLMFEQAAFDVNSYEISLRVDPSKKSISGTSTMKARVVIPTNVVVLDLDTPYAVSAIDQPGSNGGQDLKWERRDDKGSRRLFGRTAYRPEPAMDRWFHVEENSQWF
jgi:hypothetical protein